MKDLPVRYRSIMLKAKLNERIIESFLSYLQQVIAGETGFISSLNIKPPDEDKLIKYEELANDKANNLGKLVVIKLNGGLGTTMGLDKAKSLLPVKSGLNFLGIIAHQIIVLREKSGQKIPLLFMNSYNTNEDTLNYLSKYPMLSLFEEPLGFTQHKYPRVRQEDFLPYEDSANEMMNWNPPGHGDIYQAMSISGVLDKLLERGIDYAFISNADNLGAVVDKQILDYVIMNDIPFLMEVCIRQEIDKKGGHLAQDENGLLLREIAQCPQDELNDFQNIELYRYFNTNNLWINLKKMKEMAEKKSFTLPLIVNAKSVAGTNVFQIETAMGSAISKFPGANALIVPRLRFAPVKKTSDLLTIQSDAYILDDDFRVSLYPECKETPYVELDERYYKTIQQLEEHFPQSTPSLKNCRRLIIEGDITFGENVVIEGDVTLKAGKPVCIENMVISNDLEW